MFPLSIVGFSTATGSGEQVFKNIVGTVVSPNYPKHYGNNEYRQYYIAPPTLSEIVLIIHHFDVEQGPSCMFDYLEASTLQFFAIITARYYTLSAVMPQCGVCMSVCLSVHL